jgi:diphthamide biosynthesis protein 7
MGGNLNRCSSSALGSLVVSLSNGSLCHLSPSESGLSITNSWHAHDFEPWIAAWDYWDSSLIYSGRLSNVNAPCC